MAGGKAPSQQPDEPGSSKQPGQVSHAADDEPQRQGPSHSPARDEMAEEEEESGDEDQQLSDTQVYKHNKHVETSLLSCCIRA